MEAVVAHADTAAFFSGHEDPAEGSISSLPARVAGSIVCGVITFVFATVGTILGAITGGMIGLATESGLVRGAGIGAISGAVVAMEVVDRSVAMWRSDESGIWSVLYVVLAPLPIGFAVFMVHLATIPITGTGINPARSLGAAVIYNNDKAWDDHWIFWVGPFIGAAIAALYHQYVLRASATKFGSSASFGSR